MPAADAGDDHILPGTATATPRRRSGRPWDEVLGGTDREVFEDAGWGRPAGLGRRPAVQPAPDAGGAAR